MSSTITNRHKRLETNRFFRWCSVITVLIGMSLVSGAANSELKGGFAFAYGTPPAHPLVLESLDASTTYDLAAMRGQVVVINFWATWCLPCVEELPTMARMWEQLSPLGLELLAVNAGEKEERIEAFLETLETPIPFPLLIDKTADVFKSWNISGLPMTYVVDKRGRIRYSADGARQMDADHIMDLLRGLLEEESGTN